MRLCAFSSLANAADAPVADGPKTYAVRPRLVTSFVSRNFTAMIARSIAGLVLFLALVLGLTKIRVFPFSRFPMFAYTYREPAILTLMWVDRDGESHVVPTYALAPMTRLFLSQNIRLARDNGQNQSEALKGFVDQIRERIPEARGLQVVKVFLKPAPHGQPPYEIVDQKVYREVSF